MNQRTFTTLVFLALSSQTTNAGMFDDLQSVAGSAGIDVEIPSELKDFDPSAIGDSLNLDNITEQVTNASGGMIAPLVAYAAGARGDIGGMTELLKNAKSAGGVSEEQKAPYDFYDDIADSAMRNLSWDCVEYQWLGECISYRTWPPAMGTSSIAENRVGDLHVEITSHIPSEDETSDFGEPAANAPSDTLLGDIPQKINAIMGRAINITSGSLGMAEDLASVVNSTVATNNHSYMFREAMVIGNPTMSLTPNPYSSLPGFCNSMEMPYATYFTSSMDLLSWRWISTTETILLGVYSTQYLDWNDVGKDSDFGSVMPRMGYVVTREDHDAALTAAYRSLSIVNDARPQYHGLAGLHLFVPASQYASGSYTNQGGDKYRTVKDHLSIKLSEFYPNASKQCSNYQGYTISDKDAKNKQFVEDNAERSGGWKAYRPLSCCARKYDYLFGVFIVPRNFEVH